MSNCIDFEAFHSNYGNLVEIEKKIAMAFIGEASNMVGEFEAALASGDEKKIRFHSHTMKGASANVFASPLVEGFKQIENYDGAHLLPFAREKFTELKPAIEVALQELRDFLS
ncbi:MAG: Hpt domain-containing protein [Zetaproteobacteria bacterium]|nr:Hpt domain-containing protein [Zetaproteobacteria bacterium]